MGRRERPGVGINPTSGKNARDESSGFSGPSLRVSGVSCGGRRTERTPPGRSPPGMAYSESGFPWQVHEAIPRIVAPRRSKLVRTRRAPGARSFALHPRDKFPHDLRCSIGARMCPCKDLALLVSRRESIEPSLPKQRGEHRLEGVFLAAAMTPIERARGVPCAIEDQRHPAFAQRSLGTPRVMASPISPGRAEPNRACI